MRKLPVLSLLIIGLSVGCVGVIDGPVSTDDGRAAPVDPPRGDEPERFSLVRIWIQDHIYLPKLDVADGCNFWNVEGPQCVIVPKEENDLEFVVNMQDCVADEKGEFPPSALAFIREETKDGVTTKHGRITYWPRCFDDNETGRVDMDYFRAITAHEVGHEHGIWDHVPDTCDERVQKDIKVVDGIRLCGPAIMNSYAGARKLTQLDRLAYKSRSDVTVLKGDVTTTRHALTTDGVVTHECSIPRR